jgi:hypothetical protein
MRLPFMAKSNATFGTSAGSACPAVVSTVCTFFPGIGSAIFAGRTEFSHTHRIWLLTWESGNVHQRVANVSGDVSNVANVDRYVGNVRL